MGLLVHPCPGAICSGFLHKLAALLIDTGRHSTAVNDLLIAKQSEYAYNDGVSAENAGREYAGLENEGPSINTGKRRIGNCGTGKMKDRDYYVDNVVNIFT